MVHLPLVVMVHLLAWIARAGAEDAGFWHTIAGAPGFVYSSYGMASKPPSGPSYLASNKGIFELSVSETGEASMVKVWNHTMGRSFGNGGEFSVGETGLMLFTRFNLNKYAWYRLNSTSDWASLHGHWSRRARRYEFTAQDEAGEYKYVTSDNRYPGYAYPWRPGPDGRIYIMLHRHAASPPPDVIPEHTTRARYAVWSFGPEARDWRRETPDLPGFRGKSLKTFTRGCTQCQGVSGFDSATASWSGLSQVKYGNGRGCRADQPPLENPACWKPRRFSLPQWGGNHTRGLYLRACHGSVAVERVVISTNGSLTASDLEALPLSEMVGGVWHEPAGGLPLVIDAGLPTGLVPAAGESESEARVEAGALFLNGTREVRGRLDKAATEPANAEYKVRWQPVNKANERRYVYLRAQSTGPARPSHLRHCVHILTSGYFNQWNPRFEIVQRPSGAYTIYAGNTNVDSVSRCDDSPEEQPSNGVMLLEAGAWMGLSGPELKYRKEGFTCGWGRSSIFVSTDRKELFVTGGSGQYYTFDEEHGRWLVLDEVGYGDKRGFLALGQTRVSHTMVAASGSYKMRRSVEGADCRTEPLKNQPLLVVPGEAGSSLPRGFLMELRTELFANCTNLSYGTEEEINDWGETLAERRAAASESGGRRRRRRGGIKRGHVFHPFDASRLTLKSLDVQLATYHPLSASCQSETLTGIGLAPTAVVTCGTFPARSPQHAVVWLDENTGIELASADLPSTPTTCQALPSGDALAVGTFGVRRLAPAGGVIWQSAELPDLVSPSPLRGGRIAVLGTGGAVAIHNATSGELLARRDFTYDYVTAIELFTDGRVAVGAFTNNRAGNPVQIARMETYSADLQTMLTQTWGGFSAQQLADSRNMADTRVYSLALSDTEEYVYVAGESAGGNTIYRWNGQDLSTATARDTGTPMWMAKSDAHVGYVGRIRASDGVVVAGTFVAPILRSAQRLNTFRTRGGALQHDPETKAVYLTGTSTCCIPGRTSFTLAGQRIDGGDPSGYAGSDPSLVAFTEDLGTRRMWTTFSQWRNKGKPVGLHVKASRVAVAVLTHGGTAITTASAVLRQPPDMEVCEDGVKDRTDAWIGVIRLAATPPASFAAVGQVASHASASESMPTPPEGANPQRKRGPRSRFGKHFLGTALFQQQQRSARVIPDEDGARFVKLKHEL